MIRINLLPVERIRKRQRLGREVAAFGGSFVLLLVLLGAVGFGMVRTIGALHGDIRALEEKKKSYRPILRQIAKLQKDKKTLETKLQAITRLKAGSQLTVRVLDEVASRTPVSRMWLTALNQSGSQLSLTGVALDNATIAQYMQALEASPFFAGAELANSSQTVVAGQKLKSFALALQLVQPAPVPGTGKENETGPR